VSFVDRRAQIHVSKIMRKRRTILAAAGLLVSVCLAGLTFVLISRTAEHSTFDTQRMMSIQELGPIPNGKKSFQLQSMENRGIQLLNGNKGHLTFPCHFALAELSGSSQIEQIQFMTDAMPVQKIKSMTGEVCNFFDVSEQRIQWLQNWVDHQDWNSGVVFVETELYEISIQISASQHTTEPWMLVITFRPKH